MITARILFLIGGLIFVVLGGLHAVYSLLDVKHPRRFCPTDDQVRERMAEVGLRLSGERTSMWLAWLGFNISHGLGVFFFGLVALLIAVYDFGLVGTIVPILPISIFMSAAYFVLSLKFWFYVPSLGAGIATVCFVLSSLMILLANTA